MTASPLRKEPNGKVSWIPQPGDSYLVTGICRDGRRFRRSCSSWAYAAGINLWRGSRWLVRDGHRYRINTTVN